MSYGGIPNLDTKRLNSREGKIAMPVRGKRTHLYRPGTPRYGPDRRGLCGQRAKRKTGRPTEVTCGPCPRCGGFVVWAGPDEPYCLMCGHRPAWSAGSQSEHEPRGKRADKSGRYSYGEQNKLLVHVPSGVPVDVFSSSIKNWGMSLMVRTGPKEFNVRMMSRFRELGMRGHAYGGVTDQGGTEIECPDEETVFRLLSWPWMPPERRL